MIPLRPYQSEASARATRSAVGIGTYCWLHRSAAVLDHAGGAMAHALPQDDRDWSLEPAAKQRRGAFRAPCRTCPVCFAVLAISVRICPECYRELADLERTQWPMSRCYQDRESAAEDCAAFVLAAVPLLLASLRGVIVLTPGDRQSDALDRDWRASPEYRADEYGRVNEARRTFERAWRAEHSWREFA